MRKSGKNRLPPFVPLLVTTLDAPAWKALSHGAKALYVALRRRVPNGRNQAYISFRQAKAQLRSRQDSISEWFRELRHYGFIVLASPGYLGVEGRGKAPHWRLTELGVTSKASAGGLFELLQTTSLNGMDRRFKKQNRVPVGGYAPYTTVGAVPHPQWVHQNRKAYPTVSAYSTRKPYPTVGS